ncbi:hypothetical protein F9879_19685, partial [Morganella morganii]|uniref:invasin domain 3-containing protein n=1 Tax=Morganella morganii TaxID=582 RepID=UPI0015F6E7FB
DNPVTGHTVLFSTELADTTFGTVTDNLDGTYTGTLKGTKKEDAIQKKTVNGSVGTAAPRTVKLTSDSSNVDKGKWALTADQLTSVAK